MHIETVQDLGEKSKCIFVGCIEEAAISRTSKNGNRYAKMVVGDETAAMRVMIFSERLDQCKEINGGLPKAGEIVIVKGTKMDEPVFANVISIQDR